MTDKQSADEWAESLSLSLSVPKLGEDSSELEFIEQRPVDVNGVEGVSEGPLSFSEVLAEYRKRVELELLRELLGPANERAPVFLDDKITLYRIVTVRAKAKYKELQALEADDER